MRESTYDFGTTANSIIQVVGTMLLPIDMMSSISFLSIK